MRHEFAILKSMFDPHIGREIQIEFEACGKKTIQGILLRTCDDFMYLTGYGNISWDYWIDTDPAIYSYPCIL